MLSGERPKQCLGDTKPHMAHSVSPPRGSQVHSDTPCHEHTPRLRKWCHRVPTWSTASITPSHGIPGVSLRATPMRVTQTQCHKPQRLSQCLSQARACRTTSVSQIQCHTHYTGSAMRLHRIIGLNMLRHRVSQRVALLTSHLNP